MESDGAAQICDTNVIIEDPDILNSYKNRRIGIPIFVLEELDRRKYDRNAEVAENAREALRKLERLSSAGILNYLNVQSASSSSVQTGIDVLFGNFDFDNLPTRAGLENIPDNKIIICGVMAAKIYGEVVMVSNDFNVRVKARALGLAAIPHGVKDLYNGKRRINIRDSRIFSTEGWEKSGHKIDAALVCDNEILERLIPNQCCYLKDERGKYILAVYKKRGNYFRVVRKPPTVSSKNRFKYPLNDEQALALDLMLDPEIQCVSIGGIAGVGKTFISLLGGYNQTRHGSEYVSEPRYNLITVYRPKTSMGEKEGFLPGNEKKKFEPWARPIYDNLNLIIYGEEGRYEKDGRVFEIRTHEDLEGDLIEVCSVTHEQGRSLRNRFVIVDEAQCLTKKHIKMLGTRLAENSKLIICGDVDQIADNARVSKYSNGFSSIVRSLAGQEEYGHIELTQVVRMKIVELIANLL
ncbi:MAG: PhoH family protein [Candidatus Liptonbacteria bacterium]|nr:PhoH family protein [Candidatus Liptonbacteria bacterium]